MVSLSIVWVALEVCMDSGMDTWSGEHAGGPSILVDRDS